METEIHPYLRKLAGRRVTLVGLGRRTHVALARYLVKQGARVRVSEQRSANDLALELSLIDGLPIELGLGGHADAHVADAEIVFITPGAPRDLSIVETARANGAVISSEIELLFARCRAPIVGITGSAGKTTTTTLVGEMLRADKRQVFVGGNIGVPLIELVDEIPPDATVVLELSSFQLEALHQSAQIGAILNVTPNHLDRHPTFEHYRESKFNLLRYQKPDDIAVLGVDDPVAASLAGRCTGQVRFFSLVPRGTTGAYLIGDALVLRDSHRDTPFARVGELKLLGAHNLRNVLAAAAVASAVGASPEAIGRAAKVFPGVEHRLEFVRDLDGVRYYNDSIATSPERTVAALRSLPAPIVLVAGGRSKHLPLDELARVAAEKVRAVVTLGEMAAEIEDALKAAGGSAPFQRADSLADAVQRARSLAQPGDVVVLSPGGTSFDQFRDFEERGQQFKHHVLALRPRSDVGTTPSDGTVTPS